MSGFASSNEAESNLPKQFVAAFLLTQGFTGVVKHLTLESIRYIYWYIVLDK